MNRVLSLLVAYVFIQTQAWALSGGPVFASANSNFVVGTYAGALLSDFSLGSAAAGVTEGEGEGAVGIFACGVPVAGLATGAFIFFSRGRTFTGTIAGVADPQKLIFRALMKAQFNVTTAVSGAGTGGTAGTGTTTIVTTPGGFANGKLSADIEPQTGFRIQTANGAQVAGFRLTGFAHLELRKPPTATDPTPKTAESIDLIVDGFRQSTDVVGTVDLSALTNTQPGSP